MLAIICKSSLEKQLQACCVPETAARPLASPLPPSSPCFSLHFSVIHAHTYPRKALPTRVLASP